MSTSYNTEEYIKSMRLRMINKIIQGDCLDVMKDIPDKSIDMVLTSPPYDNLRTYNV